MSDREELLDELDEEGGAYATVGSVATQLQEVIEVLGEEIDELRDRVEELEEKHKNE